MNKTIYKKIDETVHYHKLDNGLQIYFLEKPGFNKTYVTLSTPFGSNITEFSYGEKDYTIPEGVAHFLEHKLFDVEGSDVSERFAQYGAQVNAYTMNNQTTYLFSCTEELKTNISTLLDFVYKPTFTEEGIKKEIGIIAQEINMYEDDPNAKIYMGVLKNMFKYHPVRNEILGSIESIGAITKEILTTVHEAFYDPKEMIMFVTGNIDVNDTIDFIKSHTKTTINKKQLILKETQTESKNVHIKEQIIEHDVLIPNCLMGIKRDGASLSSDSIMKQELTYSILFDLLLGKSTDNYKQLLENELINDSFGMDVTLNPNYGYVLFGTNTFKPNEFYSKIEQILITLNDLTIDPIRFDRAKKQIIGGFINALNSLEYIANQFTKYFFQEDDLFTVLDTAQSITLEDVQKLAKTLTDQSTYTTCTIMPKEKTN